LLLKSNVNNNIKIQATTNTDKKKPVPTVAVDRQQLIAEKIAKRKLELKIKVIPAACGGDYFN
ncbi:MAG: hypothetical protein LN588_00025, partial [Rickettsia endosymbiont of Bryobia graminum]|nr:hypothetical protein [Rickettsia endosymbiont of Bryobia graminum]